MTVAPRFRVLLVDDDAAVVAGLRNVLRADRDRWSVRIAEGAEPALALLAQEPADVVVTDMRMPGSSGLELLERILAEWPATARVLLSGWSDISTITRAGTVAHRYLVKPCDAETLRAELAGIEAVQAILPDPRLRAALGVLRSLPSSPSTLESLRNLPEDPDARTRAIAAAVETDVALATRLLQFVSSPSFGSPRPVTGLRAALDLIGPSLLREIASLLEPLGTSSRLPGAAESLVRLERHARTASRLARFLATDEVAADPASTAALLHDAGRLALLSRLPVPYADALRRSDGSGRTLEACEQEVLGANHARIGAYLLGLWGLPASIVEAVARHHDERALEDDGLVGVVAKANLLAHQADVSARSAPGVALSRSHP